MGKKRGAPKKPPGEVKTGTIQVRVTDDEREKIEAAATAHGTTISKWACDVLLRATKRTAKR